MTAGLSQSGCCATAQQHTSIPRKARRRISFGSTLTISQCARDSLGRKNACADAGGDQALGHGRRRLRNETIFLAIVRGREQFSKHFVGLAAGIGGGFSGVRGALARFKGGFAGAAELLAFARGLE